MASDIEERMMIFLASKKLEGRSGITLYNYMLILRKFAAYVIKPTSTINVMDIRMFLAATTKDLKPSSINTVMSCLKSFFGWLENEEYISKNPTKKLQPYKLPKRMRKSLTVEELEKLRYACVTPRERSIIEFLFATGCRVSEVVNANLEDLNLADMSLRVIGKGDKEREVYITPKAKFYLEKYISSREGDSSALFTSIRRPYGRIGVRAIEREVAKVANRACFDKAVFPHLIRHTTATLAVQAGAKLTTVQYILGHEDPATTQIYAEISKDEIKHEYKQHLIQ